MELTRDLTIPPLVIPSAANIAPLGQANSGIALEQATTSFFYFPAFLHFGWPSRAEITRIHLPYIISATGQTATPTNASALLQLWRDGDAVWSWQDNQTLIPAAFAPHAAIQRGAIDQDFVNPIPFELPYQLHFFGAISVDQTCINGSPFFALASEAPGSITFTERRH